MRPEQHPSVRIVFVSDQDLKQEVKTCMENAAKRIGVECVQLQDVEKAAGHPTATGMQQIYGQIITALKK